MLLSRYNNIDFVYNLSWIDGIELINKAIEKRNEQKDWDMWLTLYPNMDKKTFISFDKFRGKKQVKVINNTKLTKEEIIEKAEELRKLHQGKHEGVVSNGII